jgi:hypothetical protein
MSPIFSILILIGLVFGFLGACVAYLVSWNESKKHSINGAPLFKESFKIAVFTFLFFILLSVVLAFVFAKLGL